MTAALTIAGRSYRRLAAQPGELIGFVLFPIVFTVLFGYVFGSAITLPDGADYQDFLMPGIYVQVMAMSATTTATKVAEDMANGIIDRFRSLPIARSAVLVGRTLADFSGFLLGLSCMVLCGLVIAGWRTHTGVLAVTAGFGLLALFGFAMMWIGTLIGLLVKSGATADAATFSWIFPMTFLANTFVPTGNMPAWLRAIADWNPISAEVAAVRQLFGNALPSTGRTPWPLQHAVPMALAWSVAIIAAFLPLAVRRYKAAR